MSEEKKEINAKMLEKIEAIFAVEDEGYRRGFTKALAMISTAVSGAGLKSCEEDRFDTAVSLVPIAEAMLEIYTAAKTAKEKADGKA